MPRACLTVSGDDSWWPISGIKERYQYTLTPQWGADVRALLEALGAKAILGVTLKVDHKINAKIASAEVADFDRYVGASLIGPEPVLAHGSAHRHAKPWSGPTPRVCMQFGVPAHAAAILTLSA